MIDLLTQLEIVDACAAREMFTAIGVLLAVLAGIGAILWAASAEFGGKSAIGYARSNPGKTCAAIAFLVACVLYGGAKPMSPRRQQCDFRCVGQTESVDSAVNYHWQVTATNVGVVACGGACTAEVAFAERSFYYEYDARQWSVGDGSIGANGFWVRDNETNDWVGASVDSVVTGSSDGWVPGWHAASAHLPGNADPMDFRYWFVGPRANLPEKVTEVGEGITVVRQVRDAFHIFVEFAVDEQHYNYTRFVFEARRVKDGVLLDWEPLAETSSDRSFNIVGFFVGEYTETRIRGYREERK